MTEGSARVDAWLWAVRVYKTRSAATTACRAGHVRVNGDRAKAAQPVRPGDELRVRIAGFDRILVVRQPISKRVGAVLAAAAVEDRTPPPPPRELTAFVPDARPRRGTARPSASGATSTSSAAASRAVTRAERSARSRSSSQRAPRTAAPASVTRSRELAIARHHRHRAARCDEALGLARRSRRRRMPRPAPPRRPPASAPAARAWPSTTATHSGNHVCSDSSSAAAGTPATASAAMRAMSRSAAPARSRHQPSGTEPIDVRDIHHDGGTDVEQRPQLQPTTTRNPGAAARRRPRRRAPTRARGSRGR